MRNLSLEFPPVLHFKLHSLPVLYSFKNHRFLWFWMTGLWLLIGLQSAHCAPLYFEKNVGQIVDENGQYVPDILYQFENDNGTFYIRKKGVSYVLIKYVKDPEKSIPVELSSVQGHRVDINFVGGHSAVEIEESVPAELTIRKVIPGKRGGLKTIPCFERLLLKNIYPQIDIEYYFIDGKLKYDLWVHPGGEISQIKMHIKGDDEVGLDSNGNLRISTSVGEIVEQAPVSFQGQKEIRSAYVVEDNTISFDVDDWDRAHKLRVDPLREWSTYHGGGKQEISFDVTTDAAGDVYTTGAVRSINFPVTTGAFMVNNPSIVSGISFPYSAYLARFDPSGNLIWCTYFGGDGHDQGKGVKISPNGDIFVGGSTSSSNFPVANPAFGTHAGGMYDAFIARFTASGNLVWSTYYGGDDNDLGYDISADALGNVYLIGYTISTNLPTTTQGVSLNLQGSSDGFLAKFSGTGALLWTNYVGGNLTDNTLAVVCDNLNNPIVCGEASSTNLIQTGGVFQPVSGGQSDAYVAYFNANGTLSWYTYLGGSQKDEARDLAVDLNNNITVFGDTRSANFPVSANAYQTTFSSASDFFITRLSSTGGLVWSTFIGGNFWEHSRGIDSDQNGNVYFCGYTSSATLPILSNAYQTTHSGGIYDAYLGRLDNSGSLTWTTYYGGDEEDQCMSVAVHGNRTAYFAGLTYGGTFPITTSAFQTTHSGGGDGFLVKFSFLEIEAENGCDGDTVQFSLTDTTHIDSLFWSFGDPVSGASNASTLMSPLHVFSDTGRYTIQCVVHTLLGSDTLFDTVQIKPVPIIDFTSMDSVVCLGDTVFYTPSAVDSALLWSTGDTTSYWIPVQSGYVGLSVMNSCGVDQDSIFIQVDTLVHLQLGADTLVCMGDSFWIKNEHGGSFYWHSGVQLDSVLADQPGVYSISDTNSCGISSDSMVVFWDTIPFTYLGPDSIYCHTELIQLDASWSRASFLWNTGDTTSSIHVNTQGTYWVDVVNLCGSDNDTVTLQFVLPLHPNLGNDTLICLGDSVLLDPGNLHPTTWWDGQISDTSRWVKEEGIYSLIQTNACGTFSDFFHLTVLSPPQLTSINDTSICSGQLLEIEIENTDQTGINWMDDTSTSFVRSFASNGVYAYEVSNVCGAFMDSFAIVVHEPTVVELGQDTQLCNGGELPINLEYPDHDIIWWDGYDGESRNLSYSGMYGVTLISPEGCVSEDSILLKKCLPILYVPNAFTPNGDLLNDWFEVKGVEIELYQLYIFDRWGNQVFESNDMNTHWDGTYHGTNALQGIYSYRIWYGAKGFSDEKLGTVLLIRD